MESAKITTMDLIVIMIWGIAVLVQVNGMIIVVPVHVVELHWTTFTFWDNNKPYVLIVKHQYDHNEETWNKPHILIVKHQYDHNEET